MDNVVVRWNKRRQFVGWDSYGHGVVMDIRPEYKGEGTGPRPIELVLYALAGCTGMDVVSILEKKRQDVRGIEIQVQGVQREDEFPHVYTSITLHYIVTGVGVAQAAVARAIQLSEEKYCSVGGMLSPKVDISTSFTIREFQPHSQEL